jgi:hypothetical protein
MLPLSSSSEQLSAHSSVTDVWGPHIKVIPYLPPSSSSLSPSIKHSSPTRRCTGEKFQLPLRHCNWPLWAMRRGGRAACNRLQLFPRVLVRRARECYALAPAAAALGRVGSHAPTAWRAAREEGGLPTAGAVVPHCTTAALRAARGRGALDANARKAEPCFVDGGNEEEDGGR